MKPDLARRRLFRDRSPKLGTVPGSLVYVGDRKVEKPTVSVIDYDESSISEYELTDLDDLANLAVSETVSWVNVTGLHDAGMIQAIGDRFGLPDLVLEDVMNTTQHSRLEEFESFLFIIIRMVHYDADQNSVAVEQLSTVIGQNWLITFQEREGDVFTLIRDRLRKGVGRIRKRPPDYLAHALVDAIVDEYFVVLDDLGYQIEQLEEEVLEDPKPGFEARLYGIKRQLVTIRRSIWPSRELCAALVRTESPLIEESTLPYFRDAYDHTLQVMDIVESLRDVSTSIGESFRAVVGNRMNEIMKVLTIIATIFIPLTFIAGIYGMNFDNMPELHYEWGYFVALGVMLLLGFGLAAFFKKRGWF
jgi:magnesium transporter